MTWECKMYDLAVKRQKSFRNKKDCKAFKQNLKDANQEKSRG